MPPEALICATARSVFTRILAPSTAVIGALSSRRPILIGEPVAWPEPPLVLLPPQAAASSAPATAAASLQRLPCPHQFDLTLISPPPFKVSRTSRGRGTPRR